MLEFLLGLTLLGKVFAGILYLVVGVLFTALLRCVGMLKYEQPYNSEIPPLVIIVIWPFFLAMMVVIGIIIYGNDAVDFTTAWLSNKCKQVKDRFKDRIRED